MCYKPLLPPSILLFFSFSFYFYFLFLFIVWETLLCYVTQGVTGSRHGHGHMSRSQDMSHIVWLGVQDNWCTDQVDYV